MPTEWNSGAFHSGASSKVCVPYSVLSKFIGPVGQSDIFYECPTKNVECRTKCLTENTKISIWWMKRSETQVIFVGTRHTLNFI